MRPQAFVWTGLLALAGVSACQATASDSGDDVTFEGWSPSCGTADESDGSWETLVPPEGVLGPATLAPRHVFTDGETFSVFGGQTLAQLRPGDTEWLVSGTDRQVGATGTSWAASNSYLLVQGGQDGLSRELVGTAELLDLSTGVWMEVTPPGHALPSHADGAFWDGDRFILLYKGRDSVEGTAYIEASFLEPATLEWSAATRFVAGPLGNATEPTNGITDAALTDAGLFVWGILPDESRTFAALLKDRSWEAISAEAGPSVRRYHDVVAADDSVYIVGGIHVNSEDVWQWYGEVWRFSLEDETWEQIEVPDFVDPKKGAWLDGKLYVFGLCDADAVYDPASGSWALLPALPLPDYGMPHVAGGRIFLNEVTTPHGDDVPEIFVFDPTGAQHNMGGPGGN